MDSVAPHVRRIAILVTSLDAAAARQLLVHMQPELASQVRQAIARLGHVDPREQKLILAEFRKQVLSSSPEEPRKQSPRDGTVQAASDTALRPARQAGRTQETMESATYARELTSSKESPSGGTAEPRSRNATAAEANVQNAATYHARFDALIGDDDVLTGQPRHAVADRESPYSQSWKGLESEALIHLLRGERPTVIAVVLSQLSPESAVNLLKSMPLSEQSQILARLARLQEIDAEAMAAIDEHLALRLHDYRHEITSAKESLARMEALLSAASPQQRESWLQEISNYDTELAQLLGFPQIQIDRREPPTVANANSQSVAVPGPSQKPSLAVMPSTIDALKNHVVTTADPTPEPGSGDAGPRIISLVEKRIPTSNDSSLTSVEFERLLELPTQQLAEVLSTADADVVLLALAGASPEFMTRFYELLDRQDAKALQKRLRNIGPLNLRDIDEAQLEIAELAARISLTSDPHGYSRHPATRAAA